MPDDTDADIVKVIVREIGNVPLGFRQSMAFVAAGLAVEEFPAMPALAEGNAGATVLFCTRTRHPIRKSSFVRQVWMPLLERAKVPYRKFHSLRHTHASALLAAGVPIETVARRIGDRPDVVLKTYTHVIPGSVGSAADCLEALYERPQKARKRKPESGVKVEIA
jgi:hypothetical protein